MINDKGKGKKKSKPSAEEQYRRMLRETSPAYGTTPSNRPIDIPKDFTWPPKKLSQKEKDKRNAKFGVFPSKPGGVVNTSSSMDQSKPALKKGGSVKSKKK